MDSAYSVLALHLIREVSNRVDDLARAATVDSDADLLALIRDYSLGIDPQEALARVERVRRGLQKSALEELQVTFPLATEAVDHFQIEGNTVRNLGGAGARGLAVALPEPMEVTFWTDGDVSEEEEEALHIAIQKVLGEDIQVEAFDPPIRGSFFQLIRVKGLKKSLKKAIGNIKSAMDLTVTRANVKVIVDLAKVLEKHQNVVLKVDGFVAIKYTENRKVRTFVGQIPEHVELLIAANPGLSTNPGELLALMEAGDGRVVAFDRTAKVLSIGSGAVPREDRPGPAN